MFSSTLVTPPFYCSSVAQLVPTVFRWEHGGRQVYITGTFNNWEKQIPMHRSGNDFTYIHSLKVRLLLFGRDAIPGTSPSENGVI